VHLVGFCYKNILVITNDFPLITTDGIGCAVATNCHVASTSESVPLKLFLSALKEFSRSVKDLRVVIVAILVLVCNSRPSTNETCRK
jgi:GTP:adenosylcobinamide-phosphate guanylyltransferase